MKVQHVVGCDLSKHTIDVVLYPLNEHRQILNKARGFLDLMGWLKSKDISLGEVLVLMEHTGLYSFLFEGFLQAHHLAFSKVSALQIKRSLGIVRGKTDRLDAERIALYGWEKKQRLSVHVPLSGELQRLQLLQSTRARLVAHRASLICAVKEYRNMGLRQNDPLLKGQLRLIAGFGREVEKLEGQIQGLLVDNQELEQNFSLLQSIKGVGKVLAVATLVKTANFTRFASARKFCCYCGTAPFEHQSGSSIKGRTRVSHLADKEMKTLLDLSAKSAIGCDEELKAFYERRLQMGKSKMSTINIVRNKIIYRMFAVIKRQSPFQQHYHQVA